MEIFLKESKESKFIPFLLVMNTPPYKSFLKDWQILTEKDGDLPISLPVRAWKVL